jgi:hypothetical protein
VVNGGAVWKTGNMEKWKIGMMGNGVWVNLYNL